MQSVRHPRFLLLAAFAAVLLAVLISGDVLSQLRGQGGFGGRERAAIREPFAGITTNGEIQTGLFSIQETGVSTAPVLEAARNFLGSLSDEQRDRVFFPVDDSEWRRWANQHSYRRQGVSFEELDEGQREAAFGLMKAGLSAKGFRRSRDIMRLNYTLGEITGNFAELDEWFYYFTVMGEPSENQPWGWQLDGHHLIVNYFVL
ncbi:MAG: DUF3500 domain-containing protein, partial [Bryobacterales bacterium]|nr:DUF3500 domain-containing protein [Bryobacterales bacterium]